MNVFKADLHIHTVLSPCGNLEMSPTNIVNEALKKGLKIIGITDHNSTLHCELVKKIGARNDIFVLTGAEVNTKEEVHCLTFFETSVQLNEFQEYIELHLPYVKNNPKLFGYQVVVDEGENIIRQIDSLLISALDQSIDLVREKVRELNGIFIPSHINRQHCGILCQLGFIPDTLNPDALEVFAPVPVQNLLASFPKLTQYSLLKNSDAHCLERIGASFSNFYIKELTFEEIRKALQNSEGRKVVFE